MKKAVYKKLLGFCMLFFSVFFILVPGAVFAKPGQSCKGDMDCADTKGSICIPAIGNLCGNPGDGCTVDKDCTVSGEKCNTAKRWCEATTSAPACPSGKQYDPKTGLCGQPAGVGSSLGACCVGTTPGKAEPDCIGVYANVTNCDDVKKSGATYTLQNKPRSQIAARPSTTKLQQPSASTKEDTYIFTPIEPKLQIDIPTVKFSKITKEGQELGIPYLAEYIAGIYKYAVAIGSIVAIVMIMVGGLRWMTAGGSASAIDAAKSRISNAVIGLILLLGSYTVLYTINPDLVSFKELRVMLIDRELLEGDHGSDNELSSPPGAGSAANCGQYDNLFKKYSPCLGADWKILKTIAAAESGCNANIDNGRGYYGMAQTRAAGSGGSIICPGLLNKTKFAGKCTAEDLKNPEIAIAIMAKYHKKKIAEIKKYCKDASPIMQGAAIHAYHNVPTGAYNFVKKGCKNKNDFVEGFLNFYLRASNAKAKQRYFADKTYKSKYADKINNETEYLKAIAAGKIDYSIIKAGNIFNALGGNINNPAEGGSCPL